MLAAMPFLIGETRTPAPAKGEKRSGHWPRGWPIYILGMMALFSMVPEGGVLDWAALYLTQGAWVRHSPPPRFGFAMFAGTMAVVRFMGDAVRNRFGAVATLRVSGLIGAAGMLGAAVAPADWLAIACFAFSGLGIANMVPIVLSAAGNHPGAEFGQRHRRRHDDGLFRHPDRALGHRLCRRACGLSADLWRAGAASGGGRGAGRTRGRRRPDRGGGRGARRLMPYAPM